MQEAVFFPDLLDHWRGENFSTASNVLTRADELHGRRIFSVQKTSLLSSFQEVSLPRAMSELNRNQVQSNAYQQASVSQEHFGSCCDSPNDLRRCGLSFEVTLGLFQRSSVLEALA